MQGFIRHISDLSATRSLRALWAALCILAWLSLLDVAFDFHIHGGSRINIVGLALAGMMKATVLTAAWAAATALRRRSRVVSITVRWLCGIAIGVFALLSLVNGVAFLTYGMGISRKMMTVMMQTNAGEVGEFMPGLMANIGHLLARPALWIAVAVLASFTQAVVSMPRKAYLWLMGVSAVAGAAYSAWFAATRDWGRSNLSVALRTVSAALSSQAHVTRYIGSEDSEDHLLTRYDDELLPVWRSFMREPGKRKFAVVHLMGSHTEYARRYPPERSPISGADVMEKTPRRWLDKGMARTVAEYDNSIAFTDSILGELINETEATERPAMVVYISDHGENVYDTGTTRGRDITSIHVPLIIFLNRAYLLANGDIAASLHEATKRRVSTADIAYMIMTLTGTAYRWYDATHDAMSPRYHRPTLYVDGEAAK